MKFVDPDKPAWQRAAALEVLFRMTTQSDLLLSFCECYDLKTHSTNIFQDIVNCLGAYVQSVFLNPQLASAGSSEYISCGILKIYYKYLFFVRNFRLAESRTTKFYSRKRSNERRDVGSARLHIPRGIFTYLRHLYNWSSENYHVNHIIIIQYFKNKSSFLISWFFLLSRLEYTEKTEPPNVPNGHGLAVAFASFLEIVRSLSAILEKTPYIQHAEKPSENEESSPHKANAATNNVNPPAKEKKLYCQLINSSWCGILSALVPLIDGR